MLAAIAAAALLTACSSTPPTDTGAAAGSGTTVATAGGPVVGSQEDLVKTIGDRVFFDFDRSVVKAEGKATLERQAGWLKQFPQNNIQVAGNADERGSREYNLALGQKRADALKKAMQLLGAKDVQLESVSLGKEKPKALEHDEAAWAANRRDDILYRDDKRQSGEF